MSSRRSRGGCEPCRRSHVKCDEQRPACEYCVDRNLECTYRDLPIAYSPLIRRRHQSRQPPPSAPRLLQPTATDIAEYDPDYSHSVRQHSQSFGGYYSVARYNVPQSPAQKSLYDARQFGSQPPAGLQMTTPDVSLAYSDVVDDVVPHNLQSAAAADVSGSSSIYHQNPSKSCTSSGVTPSAQQLGADVSTNEKEDHSDADLDKKWKVFQRQLSAVNQDISTGSLQRASNTLLSVSSWLLDHVAELGLTKDEPHVYASRMKLWEDLNHAWLALGQKQVDLWTSDQQQSTSQFLMPQDTIETMGNRLCVFATGSSAMARLTTDTGSGRRGSSKFSKNA